MIQKINNIDLLIDPGDQSDLWFHKKTDRSQLKDNRSQSAVFLNPD